MFRHGSIAMRLFLLLGIMAVFDIAMVLAVFGSLERIKGMSVEHTQKVMLEGHKNSIKSATHSMAQILARALEDAGPTRPAAETIRRVVDGLRYEADESGYYFVYRGTVNVALPPRPELVGCDLADFKDDDGVYYVRELAARAGAGGGFVEYIFPKPGQGEQKKLSYAEQIPGTPYWVGTGVYIDNVEREKLAIARQASKDIQSRITAVLTAFSLLFLLMLGVCFAMARSIIAPIVQATQAAERIARGELEVVLDGAGQDEAARLQKALNNMMVTLRRDIQEIDARRREAEDKAAQAERAGQEVVRQIAQRIESLRNISSAVAHQLRNPTTIIAGFANLLLKKPELRESSLEYLDGIILAARRIERISGAVGEYSAIHLGSQKPTALAQLLERSAAWGRERAQDLGKSPRIEVEAAPDAVAILDDGLVELAVRELLQNALEALDGPEGVIRLHARREGETLAVSVIDTGRGIPEKDLPFILDPFYTTKAVGIGMGLTKVARIVQEHDGTLVVQSPKGQGSSVVMRFPADPSKTVERAP